MDYVNHIPLPEYPRPQLVRENYTNLNGAWNFAFSTDGENAPTEYSYKITVPFSPETAPSGIMKAPLHNEFLWYNRFFSIDAEKCSRVILHFGAVDQTCSVYVNGSKVGSHVGGYNAFSFDIAFLSAKGMDIKYLTDSEEDHFTMHCAVLEHSAKTVFLMSKETRGKRYQHIITETDNVIIITDE